MNASCEAKLRSYADLIQRWNPAINLVAPSTLDDLWNRHIVDSTQLADLAPAAGTWLDIGSGGGLPGVVVAICRPDLAVTLLNYETGKATLLRN